jgi:hypothetical protein
LPGSTLAILKPLLDELNDLEETLNFEEFCEAMEILIKKISPAERSELLKTCKARPQADVYEFKPKIIEWGGTPKRPRTPMDCK